MSPFAASPIPTIHPDRTFVSLFDAIHEVQEADPDRWVVFVAGDPSDIGIRIRRVVAEHGSRYTCQPHTVSYPKGVVLSACFGLLDKVSRDLETAGFLVVG